MIQNRKLKIVYNVAFLFHLYDKHIPPNQDIAFRVMAFPSNSGTNVYILHVKKVIFIRCLTQFTWNVFATSYEKGKGNEIGRRAESLLV